MIAGLLAALVRLASWGSYVLTGLGATALTISTVYVLSESGVADTRPPQAGVLLPFSFHPDNFGPATRQIYGADQRFQDRAFDTTRAQLSELSANQLAIIPAIDPRILAEVQNDDAARNRLQTKLAALGGFQLTSEAAQIAAQPVLGR